MACSPCWRAVRCKAIRQATHAGPAEHARGPAGPAGAAGPSGASWGAGGFSRSGWSAEDDHFLEVGERQFVPVTWRTSRTLRTQRTCRAPTTLSPCHTVGPTHRHRQPDSPEALGRPAPSGCQAHRNRSAVSPARAARLTRTASSTSLNTSPDLPQGRAVSVEATARLTRRHRPTRRDRPPGAPQAAGVLT